MLWSDRSKLGIVRFVSEDVIVVESDGRLTELPANPDVDCVEGNTVRFETDRGVTSIVSEESLDRLDRVWNEEPDIERFRPRRDLHQRLDFDDFGGLVEVVKKARKLVEIPLAHGDALRKIGAKPIKGVLFTGLPGTGKTHLAKIIADQAGSTFYEISGPTIFSKWYGESEKILRLVFDDAAKQESAIIFFDEIDSVAAARSSSGHEASNRVVGQLLTLMDGFEPTQQTIVIAATNRPQDLDPALRRPGRFDWEIAFPLPSETDRFQILKTTTKSLAVAENLELLSIAKITEGWSAAELTAVWAEAALFAVVDDRMQIRNEDLYAGYEEVAKQREGNGRSGRRVWKETQS